MKTYWGVGVKASRVKNLGTCGWRVIKLTPLHTHTRTHRGSQMRHDVLERDNFWIWQCIAVMMEAVRTYETSVTFYESARRKSPDRCLHTHRRENLKYNLVIRLFIALINQYAPLKRRSASLKLHGAIFQKAFACLFACGFRGASSSGPICACMLLRGNTSRQCRT